MTRKKSQTLRGERIVYGTAVMILHTRSDGRITISWNEGGRHKRTTRADLASAREWAGTQVRQLDAATGSRMVTPLQAERTAWLERIAGGAEAVPRLLAEIEDARKTLSKSGTSLRDAVEWYVRHGPPAVCHSMTLAAAVAAFLAEYDVHHPTETVRPVRSILNMASSSPAGGKPLLEITHEDLDPIVRAGSPADRTIQNRIACLITFFRRAEALGWWPDGKRHPASLLKRPRKVDKAPEIYSPAEGAALLRWAMANPQHLPFLLIAGWLGARPSECQRVRWRDFDFTQGLLHLRAEVARKTMKERWIPICPTLLPHLSRCAAAAKKPDARACRFHSRARISEAARLDPKVGRWIADGLRHSYITYRLQIVENIDRVADEAGNSASEIRQSYRRPIPPGRGTAWWEVLKTLR